MLHACGRPLLDYPDVIKTPFRYGSYYSGIPLIKMVVYNHHRQIMYYYRYGYIIFLISI